MTRTVKALTTRDERPSSLTRKNRPLNKLIAVASNKKMMAILSMGNSGGRVMLCKCSIARLIQASRPAP